MNSLAREPQDSTPSRGMGLLTAYGRRRLNPASELRFDETLPVIHRRSGQGVGGQASRPLDFLTF